MPGNIKQYDINIKEVSKGKESNEMLKVLRDLKNIASTRSPRYRDVDVPAIVASIDKLINSMESSQKDLGKRVGELATKLQPRVAIKERGVEAEPPSKYVNILNQRLKNLETSIQKLAASDPGKKVAILDIESGPIKSSGKYGKRGKSVDFITQVGVIEATLNDILTKTADELKKTSIKIKPQISRLDYDKEFESLKKKGFKPIPYDDLLAKDAKSLSDAMKDVEKVLKRSSLIVGHNLEQFDIKVLGDALKEAGSQIELGTKEYYDTLTAARKEFGGQRGFGKGAHTLGSYERDFAKAGNRYTSALHDASHDVEVTADLMKALAGPSKELQAAQSNLSNVIDGIADKIHDLFGETEKVAKETTRLAEEIGKSADSQASFNKSVIDADKKIQSVVKDYTKEAFLKKSLDPGAIKSMKSTVFTGAKGGKPIYPLKDESYKGLAGGLSSVDRKTEVLVNNLSRSLFKLQSNIVKSLENGLRSGWKILEDREGGQKFKLAPGGREWELTVVDVNKIKQQLKGLNVTIGPQATAGEAREAYKQGYIRRESSQRTDVDAIAAEVEKFLSKVDFDKMRKEGVTFASSTQDLAKQVKTKQIDSADIKGLQGLSDIFRKTVLTSEAIDDLNKNFSKVLSLPAAEISEKGTLGFKTKYGSERALANFATIETGVERLAKTFKDLGGAQESYLKVLSDLSVIPFKPDPVRQPEAFKEMSTLASELVDKVKQAGGQDILQKGYKEAIQLRLVERGEPGRAKALDSAVTTGKDLGSLEEKAKSLGITAIDVAKALDQVNFENFYDVLDRLYQAGKTPFLEDISKNLLVNERDVRKVAKVKDELLGALPLVEPGRPRRQAYEEEVLKVFTRPIKTKGFGKTLRPSEQEQHIVDVALAWKEMAKNAKSLGKEGIFSDPSLSKLGRLEAKPIDLSDSASSQLTEFSQDSVSALKDLNSIMISASTAGIRGLAPFEQFSSIARQQSYAVNPLAGGLPGGKNLETPSLQSTRERELIESGKYGPAKSGYGLNVLTELRSTAGTFEDQILISGRLANAFTKITKQLVGPAEDLAGTITKAEGGYKKLTRRGKEFEAEKKGMSLEKFEETVGKVSDEFQKILGVEKPVRSGADIAKLSKDVQNITRVHRGESIDVQAAELTEIFLNYFGRKLSTRFGSKGVSVSVPTGIEDISDITQALKAGVETKVAPPGGLGFARVPKSAGQLLSELFESELKTTAGDQAANDLMKAMFPEDALNFDEHLKELTDNLRVSGNKFIIDLFKDASKGSIVESGEAKKQQALFKKVSDVYSELFGEELLSGLTGLKQIQSTYSGVIGKPQFETKPIEARISAGGIAKRGLMPEVLEGLMNNLVGAVTDPTVLKDVKYTADPGFKKQLNEYMNTLGYKSILELEKKTPEEQDQAIGDLRKRLSNVGTKDAALDELVEFEKAWNVYTDVIDEYGNKIKSFVAPKFLQIIEEPSLFPEWREKDITKGKKGERLNFQAFAAYVDVFGAGSAMVEELANATSLTSEKHWELIRAFQLLDPAMQELKTTLLESLKSVDVSDLESFTGRTATVKELEGTIYDVEKYPTAFKTKIPSTAKGRRGESEDFYVPGPLARDTYAEELMGGKVSPTNVSRRLGNVVNAVHRVQEFMEIAAGISDAGGVNEATESVKKFASTLRGEVIEKLTGTHKEFAKIEKEGLQTPANIEYMQKYISDVMNALSDVRNVSPVYIPFGARKGKTDLGGVSERESTQTFQQQLGGDPKRFSKTLGRIMDIVIGAQQGSLDEELEEISKARTQFVQSGPEGRRNIGAVDPKYRRKFEGRKPGAHGNEFLKMLDTFQERVEKRKQVKPVFDVELEAGTISEFVEKLGINVEQTIEQSIGKALESLSRAKVAYYEDLGKSVIGPKQAIEKTFFQRVVPSSVMAKAITAVADKTGDLNSAMVDLGNMTGPVFDDWLKRLDKVAEGHKELIDIAKKSGTPVLKQGEIGISPDMADKIKLQQSGKQKTFKDLIEGGQEEPYATTVRYPFTGTLSVQAHKARLLDEKTKGLGRHTLAVPGAPELDFGELNQIIKEMREFVGLTLLPKEEGGGVRPGSLIAKREEKWQTGLAEEADMLTNKIEGLIEVINTITPKFGAMEQKLDFDGDALFLHTGQIEESRQNIRQHFEALGKDVTSVRSLFNTVFTAIEGKDVDVSTLAEMSKIFSGKHPAEKGFDFLTKPYITENVENLGLDEVFTALSTYSKDIVKTLETTTLPSVERAAGGEGVSEVERKDFTDKILGAARATTSAGGAVPFEFSVEPGSYEQTAGDVLKNMLRTKLYEEKYSDAIIGQLYKIQTGPTVEGISRVARLSELETGFGGGLAGTGKEVFDPTEAFLEKWPKESVALGGRPVQEFATRINELLRFVIQKGMDVKHAGVEPVGRKIIENIGKKSGVSKIVKAMTENLDQTAEDQFEELNNFNAEIANEARLRLGAVSTEDLQKELKRFDPGADVGGLDRKTLIEKITKQIDMEAVFEEVFRMIKRAAIRGYTKELQGKLEELPVGERAKVSGEISRQGGFGPYATKEIESEAAGKGISILKYITTNLEPLYKLRTSMETLPSVAKRTPYRVDAGSQLFPSGEEEAKRLKQTYIDTLKTAHVLSRSIGQTIPGAEGGVHTMLVLSAAQKRLGDLDKLAMIAKEQNIPMEPEGAIPTKRFDFAGGAFGGDASALFASVWDKFGVSVKELESGGEDAFKLNKQRLTGARKAVEQEMTGLSKIAGVPMLGKEEQHMAFSGFSKYMEDIELKAEELGKTAPMTGDVGIKQATEDYSDFLKDLVKFQGSMSEQARRISEAIKTVPFEKQYMEAAFEQLSETVGMSPTQIATSKKTEYSKDLKKTDEKIIKQRENRIEAIQAHYAKQEENMSESFKTPNIGTIGSAGIYDSDKQEARIAQTRKEVSYAINKMRNALKGFNRKLEGGVSNTEKLGDIYRASGLEGGGGFGGTGQVESIVGNMFGTGPDLVKGEVASFRGTALHRRKQLELAEKYKKFGGFNVEGIAEHSEEGQQLITGHFDVLYKESQDAQQRLADIKTVYNEEDFDVLAAAAQRIKEGSSTLTKEIENFESSQNTTQEKLARKLKDYLSQINFYLSNNITAVGELILISQQDPSKEISIEVGAFDPALFAKDIEAVKKAQAKFKEIMGALASQEPEQISKAFAGYDKLRNELESKLGKVSYARVSEELPLRPTYENMMDKRHKSFEEFASKLNEDDQQLFEELADRYAEAFERAGGDKSADFSFKKLFASGPGAAGGIGGGGAGAPPGGGPPGGVGGGDGGDDDFENFRKKIESILNRLQQGAGANPQEIYKLMQVYESARIRFWELAATVDGERFKDLEKKYQQLQAEISSTVDTSFGGGFESAKKVFKMYSDIQKGSDSITSGMEQEYRNFRDLDIDALTPDTPSGMAKNLKALYQTAVRRHGLLGKDEDIFGKDIKGLLGQVKAEGPSAGVAREIIGAVDQLPQGSRGYTTKIWQHYRKAIAEYFLGEIDKLQQEIEGARSKDTQVTKFGELEKTIQKYRQNIVDNLGKSSDIYTEKGFGRTRQFVDPKLARLTGVFKTPNEIEEIAKGKSGLEEKYQPIFESLVQRGDEEGLDNLVAPIQKVRDAFAALTVETRDFKDELLDDETFDRFGKGLKFDEILSKWDFTTIIKGVTQLRAALESWNRMQVSGFGDVGPSPSYTEEQRKNVEETIKLFRQLERSFVPSGGTATSEIGMGLTDVPGFLGVEQQKLLHQRNIATTREFFARPEVPNVEGEAPGAERGRSFTYRQRIVDPSSKQVISNMATEFTKVGDAANSAGTKVGYFSENSNDLIAGFQGKQGFGQAFQRVIKWGAASSVVWGTVQALQEMVSVISDVETGMAVLRQVMSPLETDFEAVQNSAMGFAKEYGQGIREVIDGMRVFAQQGLAQSDVIDRTRTSVLAANVTTLSAKAATEAITAAVRVYGKEGESTVRFLDAWTEVEARHAITSSDLAESLKKAASVANTSGVSFDQLNGIITGIGETTRQTGKEIGTSLRFIFRRLTTDEGPKELSKIGIPSLTPGGDIRSAFDVLDDLAKKWDDLSSAQRINLAQAIGGTRQYNNLIVLMDHWADATETIQHSINSKGAAERRNAIVMETYAKKLEQMRSAMSELQVQFGKAFLPIAKTAVTGMKFLIEAITNIPTSIKVAITAIAGLFGIMTKGKKIFDTIATSFVGGGDVFGDFFMSLKNEFQKGIFEVFGKNIGPIDLSGLIGDANIEGLQMFNEALDMGGVETALGKMVYVASKAGRSWNNFITTVVKGGAVGADAVSDLFNWVSEKTFGISSLAGFKKGGPLGLTAKVLLGSLGSITDLGGYGMEKVAKGLGLTAEQMARLTNESTGVVGALGPMVGSFFALRPLLDKAWDGFKRLTLSAQDYEKSIDGVRRKTSGQLADIRSLGDRYGKLSEKFDDIRESTQPANRQRQLEREEYKSPLQELGKLYGESTKFANDLADVNIDMVSSFDQFGNAVLKSTKNMKGFVDVLASSKIKEMAETELGVLAKYAEDLTKTTGMETFKSEFKAFLSEIPVVGELLAKSIKVSPAKSLDILTEKVNKLLALREKYPLTTAFDVDISKFSSKLSKARKEYKATYDDFKRVLAELPTEGLNADQISEMLGREDFKAGFETILEFEPRLQVGNLKDQLEVGDIIGAEVLRKLHPGKEIDFTAELTKGLLEQGKSLKRQGEAFAGDVVFFTDAVSEGVLSKSLKRSVKFGVIDDVIEKYDVAGNQAILRMQKTSDDVIQWVVEYFDKELGKVVQKPYSDVEQFVEAIFPTRAIEDRLYDNISVLQEFVAGAGSGLRGITEKTFKKDFNLGERFFSQIPTTTLLQTGKGFEPGQGFGEVPFQQGWDKWIKDYFIKPMTDYKLLLERVSKLQLESGDALVSPGLREDIEKLQNILKNNQVVLQYRAVHVDLMKTLSESTRILKENIAAERNRNKFLVQSSGYLKGFAEDAGDISTGIQNYADLTPQQRIIEREQREKTTGPFGRLTFGKPEEKLTDLRKSFKEDGVTRQSLVESLTNTQKAIISIREISKVSEAFGSTLSPEDLSNYTEEIAKVGDTGTGLLIGETKKVSTNTAETVQRLDQLLAMGGDEQAIERSLKRVAEFGPKLMVPKLENLAEKRNKAADSGNTELAAAYDKAIDKLTGMLIKEVGPEKALKAVQKNAPLFFGKQDFGPAEFIQRSLGNTNFEGFAKALERVQPGITKTKEFTKLINLQNDQKSQQIISNKNLNGILAGYGTLEAFNSVATRKQIKKIDEQIYVLKEQAKEGVPAGEGSNIGTQLRDLMKERRGLSEKARGQTTRAFIAPIALASQELAKSFGVTEKQIRVLGGTVGGAYVAWKAWNKITGEPIPEHIQAVGDKAKEAVSKMEQSGFTGKVWKTYFAAKDVVFGKELEASIENAAKEIEKNSVIDKDAVRRAQEKVFDTAGPEGKRGVGLRGDDLSTRGVKFVAGDKEVVEKRIKEVDVEINTLKKQIKEGLPAGGDVDIGKKLRALTEERKELGIKSKRFDVSPETKKEFTSLKDRIKQAADDVKKTATTPTADKVLGENEKQTTLLHGIYEQSRRTAENTVSFTENLHEGITVDRDDRKSEVDTIISNVDVLRKGFLEQQRGPSVLAKTVGVLFAVAAAKYISEKQAPGFQANELTRRAEREKGLIDDIIAKDPEIIAEAIKVYNADTTVADRDRAQVDVEKVQKAVDTVAAREEVENKLREIAAGITDEIDKKNKSLSETEGKIASMDLAERLQGEIRDMERVVKSIRISREFERTLLKEIGGALSGISIPQLNLGTNRFSELGAHERLSIKTSKEPAPEAIIRSRITDFVESFVEKIKRVSENQITIGNVFGGPPAADAAPSYVDTARQFESDFEERAKLSEQAVSTRERIIELEAVPELTDVGKQEYEEMQARLEALKERVGELNDSLAEAAPIINDAQVAEQLRIGHIEAATNALKEQASIAVRATTVTDPTSFLGQMGLGSGGFGLTPSRGESDLTAGERLHAEAVRTGNEALLSTIETYSQLTTVVSAHYKELEDGRVKLAQLKSSHKEASETYAEGSVQVKMLDDEINRQEESNKRAAESIKTATDAMSELSAVAQGGLNIAQLVNDLSNLRKSFITREQATNFKELTSGIDKLIGGSDTLAPVLPTYDMLKGGIKPENLFNTDKYTADLTKQFASGNLVSAESRQRLGFQKKMDIWWQDQSKEIQKLQEQRSHAGEVNAAVQRSIDRARDANDMESVKSLETQQDWFKGQSKRAQEIEKTEEDVNYFRGFPVEELLERTKGIMEKYGVESGDTSQPIVEELKRQTEKIVGAITGEDQSEGSGKDFLSGISNMLKTGFQKFREFFEGPAIPAKADGGMVYGSGGPRADNQLHKLSRGEFVVNAASTSKLGPSLLSYMNSTGSLPTFKEGGVYSDDPETNRILMRELGAKEITKKKESAFNNLLVNMSQDKGMSVYVRPIQQIIEKNKQLKDYIDKSGSVPGLLLESFWDDVSSAGHSEAENERLQEKYGLNTTMFTDMLDLSYNYKDALSSSANRSANMEEINKPGILQLSDVFKETGRGMAKVRQNLAKGDFTLESGIKQTALAMMEFATLSMGAVPEIAHGLYSLVVDGTQSVFKTIKDEGWQAGMKKVGMGLLGGAIAPFKASYSLWETGGDLEQFATTWTAFLSPKMPFMLKSAVKAPVRHAAKTLWEKPMGKAFTTPKPKGPTTVFEKPMISKDFFGKTPAEITGKKPVYTPDNYSNIIDHSAKVTEAVKFTEQTINRVKEAIANTKTYETISGLKGKQAPRNIVMPKNLLDKKKYQMNAREAVGDLTDSFKIKGKEIYGRAAPYAADKAKSVGSKAKKTYNIAKAGIGALAYLKREGIYGSTKAGVEYLRHGWTRELNPIASDFATTSATTTTATSKLSQLASKFKRTGKKSEGKTTDTSSAASLADYFKQFKLGDISYGGMTKKARELYGASGGPKAYARRLLVSNVNETIMKRLKSLGLESLLPKLAEGGSSNTLAWVSPGEFIFSKDASKNIGLQNLRHMNTKGVLPSGFASGGMVTGPGGPRSDNVLYSGETGQFVIKASSVGSIGADALSSLNNNFSSGGAVGINTSGISVPVSVGNAYVPVKLADGSKEPLSRKFKDRKIWSDFNIVNWKGFSELWSERTVPKFKSHVEKLKSLGKEIYGPIFKGAKEDFGKLYDLGKEIYGPTIKGVKKDFGSLFNKKDIGGLIGKYKEGNQITDKLIAKLAGMKEDDLMTLLAELPLDEGFAMLDSLSEYNASGGKKPKDKEAVKASLEAVAKAFTGKGGGMEGILRLMDEKALGGLIGKYAEGDSIKKKGFLGKLMDRIKNPEPGSFRDPMGVKPRSDEEKKYGSIRENTLRDRARTGILDMIPFANLKTKMAGATPEGGGEGVVMNELAKLLEIVVGVGEEGLMTRVGEKALRGTAKKSSSSISKITAGKAAYDPEIIALPPRTGLDPKIMDLTPQSGFGPEIMDLAPQFNKTLDQYQKGASETLKKLRRASTSSQPDPNVAETLPIFGSSAKDLESLVHKLSVKDVKKLLSQVPIIADAEGGELPKSYATGTSYVPYNQMAYLHKGEAVVPAEHNVGGLLGVKGYNIGDSIKSSIRELVNVELKLESDTIKVNTEGITKAVTRGLEAANVTANIDTSGIPSAVAAGVTAANVGTEVRVVNLDEITGAINTLNVAGGVGADTTDGAVEEVIRKLDNRLDFVTGTITEHRTILDKVTDKLSSIDVQELRDINKTVTASIVRMEKVEGNINNLVSVKDLTIAINEMNSGLETRLTELVTNIETRYINPMTTDINGINTRINVLDYSIKDVNDVLNSTISRQDLNMSGVV